MHRAGLIGSPEEHEALLALGRRNSGCQARFRQNDPGLLRRLHLIPHVNALIADPPVRKIIAVHHFLADLTLPYGRILYDYNKADG